MQTRAEKKGNSAYVLNGEKWFSSAASAADIALVMAKTNPDAPRHQQFSTFIVELPNPGYKIIRDIKTMAVEGPLSHIMGGGHSEIAIEDLEVPADNILGGEGQGFNMGQHRLAYGRLRHGMHNVAMAQRALDMAAKQVTSRSTFGKKLSERQGVQFMLADCASELYMARLMLLHIAYKAERGMDLRQENGIAKVFLAHMVHKVVDTAIQLHGRARLQPGSAAGVLVHPYPLATPRRRTGRGASLDGRPQTSSRRTRSSARRRARRVGISYRNSLSPATRGRDSNHQILTRFPGATYSFSLGFTANAAYQASRLRTTPLTRNWRGECGSLTTCLRT